MHGEWYRFNGPKPHGEFLTGNPFGDLSGDAEAMAGDNRLQFDDETLPATPIAEIVWDRPGANSVTLTLSSYETDLGITPDDGPKPMSTAREKLIQHYLRKTLAKREGGTIHWARATLRGRTRT